VSKKQDVRQISRIRLVAKDETKGYTRPHPLLESIPGGPEVAVDWALAQVVFRCRACGDVLALVSSAPVDMRAYHAAAAVHLTGHRKSGCRS